MGGADAAPRVGRQGGPAAKEGLEVVACRDKVVAPRTGGAQARCAETLERRPRRSQRRLCEGCGALGRGWEGQRKHVGRFWCLRCWAEWFGHTTPPTLGCSAPSSSAPRCPVFTVGLPKCGTTSLQHALVSAGYGAVHCYAPLPWSPKPEERFVGTLLLKAVRQGKRPLALLPKWVNAITQMDCWWYEKQTPRGKPAAMALFPQMLILEDLDAAYPGAKFILNTRETDSWLRSVDRYGCLRALLVEADLPGLPAGAGAEDVELGAWFQAHAERVRAHFRKTGAGERLLELRLEDGDDAIKASLEAFLGRPVEWGRHNVTTWG